MKAGVVIYSNDPETVWNALRFANFCVAMKDELRVFLIGKGVQCVDCNSLDKGEFRASEQMQALLKAGAKVFTCGTCLKIHKLKAPEGFTESTMKDMYEIVRESDKVVTF